MHHVMQMIHMSHVMHMMHMMQKSKFKYLKNGIIYTIVLKTMPISLQFSDIWVFDFFIRCKNS